MEPTPGTYKEKVSKILCSFYYHNLCGVLQSTLRTYSNILLVICFQTVGQQMKIENENNFINRERLHLRYITLNIEHFITGTLNT